MSPLIDFYSFSSWCIFVQMKVLLIKTNFLEVGCRGDFCHALMIFAYFVIFCIDIDESNANNVQRLVAMVTECREWANGDFGVIHI